MHEMRHLGEQACIAAPEMFAEAMRDQNVGLETLADLHQLPDGG